MALFFIKYIDLKDNRINVLHILYFLFRSDMPDVVKQSREFSITKEEEEEDMKVVLYNIISFVIMIGTMIFTKNSPAVLMDIIGSAVKTLFPVADYMEMTIDEGNVALVYVGILSEWFISFVNLLFTDEDEKIFVWTGNTFLVLSISMLSAEMVGEKGGNLIGFLQLLFIGYMLIAVVYGFFGHGMNGKSFVFTLKMVYMNPIFIGFFLSLLRWALPLIFMMLPMLLLAIIPINIIQTIGVIIIVFLGYFFKQFSDKLMDKIDYDGTAKLIRFICSDGYNCSRNITHNRIYTSICKLIF